MEGHPPAGAITLIVTNPSSSGHPDKVVFEQARVSIGRGESNDLTLVDPQKTVSRRHAEIRCNANCHLIDLGSTNATYLNDQRLHPHTPYPIQPGDTFQIGAFTIAWVAEQQAEQEKASTDDETTIFTPSLLAEALQEAQAQHPGIAIPHRATEELALLNELALKIGASDDTKKINDTIVQYALQAVQGEQGLISLLDERDEQAPYTLMRVHEGSGPAFHVNQSLLGWMRIHQEPLRVNNFQTDPRFRGVSGDAGIDAILCAPLKVRSKLIGVLTVCNKKNGTGFTDSDERLLGIIASQSSQAIENTRLSGEEKRLQHMQKELRQAYEMQINLLPKETPVLDGYDIAGTSRPAQTVGGDYFDYIPVRNQGLAFCVGDVSGKGLPASLLMANVQATVRTHAQWSTSASTCLEETNKLIWKSTGRGVFVTLFYGVLDPIEHRLRYANAGHNRPLLFRKSEPPRRLLTAGLAIGCIAKWSYEEEILSLEQGDVLLVYSDGVTEAMNLAREEFGEDRLAELVASHQDERAEAIIQHVLAAVSAHAGKAPQADDITLIVIKRTA